MAKPIALVTELSDNDAKAFIRDQQSPSVSVEAAELLKKAKELKFDPREL